MNLETEMDTLIIRVVQIRMCQRDGRFSISGSVQLEADVPLDGSLHAFSSPWPGIP